MYLKCHDCGHLSAAEHSDREAISELANALQSALLYSVELETALAPVSGGRELGNLQQALQRALVAVRALRRH